MLLSEAIKALQFYKKKFGDLPIYQADDFEGEAEVSGIKFLPEEDDPMGFPDEKLPDRLYLKSWWINSITIENLPVKLNGKYNFVFQYYYENPDKTQSTPILGPVSATYSVSPTIQDLSTTPTNVTATGGFYSYQLKWDTPTFVSYGDTIVYESNTNSFNSSYINE